MSTTNTFPKVWDLKSIFTKNKTEYNFEEFVSSIEINLASLQDSISDSNISSCISLEQEIYQDLYTLSAFGTCLFSENTKNIEALQIQEKYRLLQAEFEKLSLKLDLQFKELSEDAFEKLLEDPSLQSVSFYLQERKHLAKDLLSEKEEELICDLSIDGYHGFSQTFETLHGGLSFPFKEENLSYGQIENKLCSANRKERIESFEVFKKVFKQNEDLFAQLINHIAGFRLKLYEKRGWDSPVFEPLFRNRMKKSTLDAMFSSIQRKSDMLSQFMQRKASLLGLKELSWHDIEPPVFETDSHVSYDKAATLIINQFETLSKDLASFAKKALESPWIDAEDRSGKSAGGFCIGFPHIKQSRIFMTYNGTKQNVATLAHELGHAYHNEVIFDLPAFAQVIKMNVAETASTMAEMIVSQALYQKAQTKEEKISALDEKISRAIAFCMNLRARFLFEKEFYELRKKGYVPSNRLSELMENAQKQAYNNSLSEYHPHFWASKLHFYFTDEPFYNFPYIFGFLLSLGFYESFKNDPKLFEEKFRAFLYDSAQMDVETLCNKHLGKDLGSQEFWDLAMDSIEKDIKEFLLLTDEQ